MRKIIILLLIILLNSFCFAYSAQDLLWAGYLKIELDKESFLPGEEITGNIVLTNEEYFPITNNTIIIQLATGTYEYPSEQANQNIVNEIILENNWVLHRNRKFVPFNIVAPNSGGKYHLSIYSWNQKSMFQGADSIFYGAKTKDIVVEGEEEGRVIIKRSSTVFGEINQIGPIGFPVSPKELFPAKIFVENKSNITKQNLELNLFVCDWSCSISEKIITKKEIIGKMNPNEIKEINLDLIAPEIPSAYEIKMVLSNNGVIESIYSNRVIVSGGTAKIRKIILKGLEEQNYSLTAVLGGSPDHFAYPNFENFEAILDVYNNENIIESKQNEYNLIKTGEFFETDFVIKEKDFDKICLRIKKDNVLFEEECFITSLKELVEAEKIRNPKRINVEWSYNEAGKNLEIILTKEGNLNSRLRLIDFEKSLINEIIEQEDSYKKSFLIEKGVYTLIIDDFDAKRQQTIELLLGINDETEINLGSEIINAEELSCTGIICQEGTVCDTQPIISKNGDCCLTQCIPNTKNNFESMELFPLIFWLSIILLIGAIIFLQGSIRKVRGRKK
ncbi:MAG: hypothetical protein PHP82_02130 [Candidatus ainarchaeum sp.]|nr:hypothetical protein [Candidatus ainarchaeum sp.]